MPQRSIFDPRNLQVMVQQRLLPIAGIAKQLGIPESSFRDYLSGRATPTLNEVVALYWYFGEPIEIILGLKDMESTEERQRAEQERARTDQLRRLGVQTPVDTGAWPEVYHTATKGLDLLVGPRNRLQQARLDELGYIVEVAKVGRIRDIRGVGGVATRQILEMILQLTGEDYRELNQT